VACFLFPERSIDSGYGKTYVKRSLTHYTIARKKMIAVFRGGDNQEEPKESWGAARG
jgi:hypothetical protein